MAYLLPRIHSSGLVAHIGDTFMRVLHTSDWHLGRLLYGQKRHHEFAAWLQWLQQTLVAEQIELLLIAGDIFDTNTPGNLAQQQYYQFLARLVDTSCRHVVVVGGNHDSPSFLDAPAGLLKAINVHVVGEARDNPADEVVSLYHQGQLEALVCAVPYLRERDLRQVEAYEQAADKDAKILQAIAAHYQATATHAEQLRGEHDIPIIGMGHLFATGGAVQEGDGVRDLYVGSLGQVPASVFPAAFDYTALGHLHVAQQVAQNPTIRYCGAPVAMGFGEVGQQKQVLRIDFAGREPSITPIEVPEFQAKARIRGDMPSILAELDTLVQAQRSVWIEIDYIGEAAVSDLRQRIADHLESKSGGESLVRVLRVRNRQLRRQSMQREIGEDTLAQLSLEDVFKRRLALSELSSEQQHRMCELHQEVVQRLHEEDTRADS